MDAQLVQPDHVLHEDIGFLQQAVEQLLDLRILQVQLQREAQLIAGVLRPGGADLLAVGFREGAQHTQSVAHAGTLYVDDLGAEVRKHRSKGHGDQRAGGDDTHAGKGTIRRDEEFAFTHFFKHSFVILLFIQPSMPLRRFISSIRAGRSLR